MAAAWPADVNETLVRHYAHRCANRSPSVSKRVQSQSRRLEAACFMRYALYSATDQLLAMFRRWAIDVTNDAGRTDLADQMLTQHAPSRRSLIRLQLMTKSAQARAMLHKLINLCAAHGIAQRFGIC